MLNEVIYGWDESICFVHLGKFSHILPVERETEKSKALIVARTTEEICEYICRVASGMHRSKAGNGDGVEKWKDIGWEELVDKHAPKGIPEVS